MAKVKYYAKENSSIGTHSFYAVPIPNGTLTFDELLDEAMDGKSVEPSIAKACVTEFMKAVKRNVLKGFRCQLGDNFLTVYPNIHYLGELLRAVNTMQQGLQEKKHKIQQVESSLAAIAAVVEKLNSSGD